MSMSDRYLEYENRRYGMDHDRYEWSMLKDRDPTKWPGDARVALLIVPALEFFPMDMTNKPFAPPGAMSFAYPDLRHYTLRDYGNRVGIYRLMDVLRRRGLKATVALNAAVAQRYPTLVEALGKQDCEFIGHGLDMSRLHHSELKAGEEESLVVQSLDLLAKALGQKPRGWLSPAKSQSWSTPDLLRKHGIEYCCDWDNDEMPVLDEG